MIILHRPRDGDGIVDGEDNRRDLPERKDSDRTVGLNRSARASADVTTVTTIPSLSPTACQSGPDQTVATLKRIPERRGLRLTRHISISSWKAIVRQQDVVVAGKERRSVQTFQSYASVIAPKRRAQGWGWEWFVRGSALRAPVRCDGKM